MPLALGLALSLAHARSLNEGGGVDAWKAALTTKGFRIFGGRPGTFNNATPKTQQMTCEVQVPTFKSVRIIVQNVGTASRLLDGASVASPATAADVNGDAATHVKVTFGGADGGYLRPGIIPTALGLLVSDEIPLASTPRTDGGLWPILLMRVSEARAGNISVMGNGVDSFTNWAARTDGNRMTMRYNDGNCCAGTGTPANFVSTTNRSQCSIVGYVLETANGEKICSMAWAGDSISAGRSTFIGNGWGVPLTGLLTTAYPGVYFLGSNIAEEGRAQAVYVPRVGVMLRAGLVPDVLFGPNYSPNGTLGDNDISDAEIASEAVGRDAILDYGARVRAGTIIWTGLPTDPSVTGFDFGASDSKRVAYNAATIADGVARGYTVVDTATPMSGATDGDGQVLPASGAMVDGIHPSNAGNTTLANTLFAPASTVVKSTIIRPWDPTTNGGAYWFDVGDLSTMKQDRTAAAATVAAAIDSPVGSWRNKGVYGGWATASSDDVRPILRFSGGLYYLEFDGVDDFLGLPAPWTLINSMTVYMGFRRAAAGIHSIGFGSFSLSRYHNAWWKPDNKIYDGIGETSLATAAANTATGDFIATSRRNATTELSTRLNGASIIAGASPTLAASSFGYIGRAASLYTAGRLYGIFGHETFHPNGSDELARAEAYIAARSGL